MSSGNATYCEGEGIDAFIAVGRDKHGQEPGAEEKSGGDEGETWATMRAKLATEQGKKLYSRRKVIVEPVFGHIKEPRGFRRFSLRGVIKVRAEWTLVCLCHNLIKLLTAQPGLASA